MSAIINRTPTGRLISLQAELKYLEKRYRNNPFTLTGMKYDANLKFSQLNFFPLAEKRGSVLYDPYLSNQLSSAGFHLTQSVQYDSQKSKSVSECFNALEALGWITQQNNRTAKISNLGKDISNLSYSDPKFLDLAHKSVLGYGVFVGFLYKILKYRDKNNIINRDDVKIGYVNTNEVVKYKGQEIPLSTGSQTDTIIRTRSTLFAWAVTTGFVLPISYKVPSNKFLWHVETLDIIKEKHWIWGKLFTYIDKRLFNGKHYVAKPLSYRYMTKSTKALRERGQAPIRNISLLFEEKIKNRRFAIVYTLGTAAKSNKHLDFDALVAELKGLPELFVVDKSNFSDVMGMEKDIAIVSGIPFIQNEGILTPLTKINLEELKIGAPSKLISALTNILDRGEVLK